MEGTPGGNLPAGMFAEENDHVPRHNLGNYCGFGPSSAPGPGIPPGLMGMEDFAPNRMTGPPPHVTISSVGGSVVQYHSFPEEEGNASGLGVPKNSPARSWRSHSLTPTVGHTSQLDVDWNSQKARSNSLTVMGRYNKPAGCNAAGAGGGNPAQMSAAAIENERLIDEMLKKLPEGSGMRELHVWLKSLRLHKYTAFLLEFSYEELLGLTAGHLPKDRVTEGAKGKILKEIGLINERPATIKKIGLILEDIFRMDDLPRLEKLQADLEKVVLMPLKPYHAPPIASLAPKLSPVPGAVAREGTHRHDSGSDSGNELGLDEASGKTTDENIPQEIFELMKKICSIIIMSDSSVAKTKVVKSTIGLIEHCLNMEAYTVHQKQRFRGWYQALRNPASFRSIRQQQQQSSRDLGCRRLSSSRPMAGPGFIRGPSPMAFKGQGGCCVGPPKPSHGMFNLMPESHDGYVSLQRRSVPDISPPPMMFHQVKRNSYQGDQRGIPISESDMLTNLMDSHRDLGSLAATSRRESTLSTASCDSGYYLSLPESRRNSSLCSSDESRRNSSLSSDDSRRNSSLSDVDSRDLFLLPGGDRRDSCLLGSTGSGNMNLSNSGGGGFFAAAGTHGAVSTSPGGLGGVRVSHRVTPPSFCQHGLTPGSVSSGCVSDGSTDSQEDLHNIHKLNQDLYNISLSVTKQALEEN